MGFSTFGGNSSNGGGGGNSSAAADGLNLLPADGRILKKADYPLAYAALQNDLMEVTTIPANMQYQNLPVANAVATGPSAFCSGVDTLVTLAAGGTVNVSKDDGK